MSRETLTKVYLEFLAENKNQVMKLIEETFESEAKIEKMDDDHITAITFSVWNWELDEEEFEGFKKYCSAINMQEYEAIDDGCFIWEEGNE